ncbi:hypothetical protein HBI22_243380 [Parastagonospora nodorum]|nr:hypothetical protein HBI28_065460 [Parastagonospora nodorum]KAH5617906.1 hypothetical protein HBI22_243380 [Parastagonospora nodorum]
MRLLKCSSTGELSLTKKHVDGEQIPPYAILSHTWRHGKEVTFDDLEGSAVNGTKSKSKEGYDKIQFCVQQAQRDGLHHVWVDTCCINKNDGTELQHAINSMFRWYQAADQCYVYLWDVSTTDGCMIDEWEPAFRKSLWFTRGWYVHLFGNPPLKTLQELLAPPTVKFFSREGKQLGDRQSLEQKIHEITGIASAALRATPLGNFSVQERLSWMKDRNTTYEEDKVYSLLGMFGVHMTTIYGEGKEYAMSRLLREIDAAAKDRLRQQGLLRASDANADRLAGAVERSQAPYLVPLQRPRFFSGRESHLDYLRNFINSEGGQRLAIYGLGGCGKTALVLESIYWTKELQPTRAIFWIPALSRDSFEQAYFNVARVLGISGIEDDSVDVKQLVKAKLSSDTMGHWLMVVDNADNASVLVGDSDPNEPDDKLMDSLPRSRKGTIIFTTRTRAAAVKLAESNTLALMGLERTEAIELLNKRLDPEHHELVKDRKTADKLLELLSFHALAIIQATAFINRNDITIKDYTILYESGEDDAIELLSEDFQDQNRYREATNAVAKTWYISFEQIQKQDPVAAEHLFFMACMASNDIGANMFLPYYTKTAHVRAIGTLKAYAFVNERNTQTEAPRKNSQTYKRFDVHPLVHLAIRAWLRAHQQWTAWLDIALARLADIKPSGSSGDRDFRLAYLNHGIHMTSFLEARNMENRVRLLEQLGSCESRLGRYRAAEKSFRRAYEQSRETFGEGDLRTLIMRGNMASAIDCQGRWTEAETILRDVVSLLKKEAGEKSPHTLTYITTLVANILSQRKLDEAEIMVRECLPLYREVFGETHDRTLTAMNQLGSILRDWGRLEDAEKMFRETITLSSRVYGEEDVFTIRTLNELGTTLHRQGKSAQAQVIYRQVLAGRIKVYGEEHPATAASMMNLGGSLSREYADPAKLAEAEQLQRRALALIIQEGGPESRYALTQKSVLADTLRSQLRYAESVHMHQEALESKEKVLGKDDPATINSVFSLATLALDQMQYEDALPLFERAYAWFMDRHGAEYPSTKSCAAELAYVRRVMEEDRVAAAEKAKTKDLGLDTADPSRDVSTAGRKDSLKFNGWRRRLQDIVKKS